MKSMAVISYLSSTYCLDCTMNVINELSTLTPPPPLLDVSHTYVCHISQKLLISLSPRLPRPPSWIPENAQCAQLLNCSIAAGLATVPISCHLSRIFLKQGPICRYVTCQYKYWFIISTIGQCVT